MMNYYNENGDLLFTDTFTSKCPDCADPIEVVDGLADPHDCEMPERFRGMVGQAWADAEQWVLDHPEQYGLVAR